MTNPNLLTPTPPPQYIYKILPSSSSTSFPIPSTSSTSTSSSSDLPLALPLSALDSRDGFIHLSTSYQLLGTLRRFFGDEPHVYILRIPYSRVESFIKWEDTEGNAPAPAPSTTLLSSGHGNNNLKDSAWKWDIQTSRGYFPHVYGNDREGVGEKGLKLGREEVDRIGMWVRRGSGDDVNGGGVDSSEEKKGEEGWTVEGWPFEEDRPVMV